MMHFYLKHFLLCLLLLASTEAFAYDISVKNSDGKTIYYNWINNKTELEVTYYLSLYNGDVNIPKSVTYDGKKYNVTSIGSYAFYECTLSISVTIPNSVKNIDFYAFKDCTGLTSVVIPNSVTSIGWGAFSGCTSLTSVSIGNSVTSIDALTFNGCTNLTSVTIPNSVTTIGRSAFEGCTRLSSIIIPNSVTSIDDNAFRICTGLTSVIIPNSVTSIGSCAFIGCTSLTSITIPNSVTSIGSYAFYGCTDLTSITIPNSVTDIGFSAFSSCTSLTSIVVEQGNSNYDSRDNCNAIIEKSNNTLIVGCQNTIIPNSVTTIDSYAFEGCINLTSVTIPNSVTSIGEKAFSGCSALASINIPNSVTSIEREAFTDCSGLTSIIVEKGNSRYDSRDNCNAIIETYFNSLIAGCKNTVIPNSVTSIGDYAFSGCTDLTSIVIPDKVKEFGYHTFYGCNSLSEMYMGDNVENIYSDAFSNSFPTIFYVSKEGKTILNLLCDEEFRARLRDKNTGERITYPVESTATSIRSIDFSRNPYVTCQLFQIDGIDTHYLTGLKPETTHKINCKWMFEQTDDKSYTKTVYIGEEDYEETTSSLWFTIPQPKVASPGNVIVSATSNIDDAEENVGFEWRRTDWTDDFKSNEGKAFLYEGTMEGYIRNLNTEKLWKVRPYYESATGKRYYGEWVGMDPTNTSYFEPTVHTYARVTIQNNTAEVTGYVMRGSDNVSSQGFYYWKNGAEARSDRAQAPAVPKNAMMVEATGNVMSAELTDLDFDTDYCYVAFVKTSENEMFYGEQRSFRTNANPTGIEETTVYKMQSAEPVRYDLRGHRLDTPRKGLNIVRLADGTVRKVVVK